MSASMHGPVVLGAVMASGLLVACSAIVGVGTYGTVAGQDGGAQVVSDSGALDTGSALVDAGAAEASAEDAAGDPPGDGGCGSWMPTTDAFKQLVRACVLWNGCSPYSSDYATGIGGCVTDDALGANQNDDRLACIAAAGQPGGTCATIQTCTGYAWATSAQCPGTAQSASCIGATAVNCPGGNYLGNTTNCSKLGGSCGVYDTDAGQQAGCIVEPTCTGTDQQCGGTANQLSYQCIDGVGYGQTCTVYGASSCDPTEGAYCDYVTPTACASGQSAGDYVCNGTTLGLCGYSNTSISYDCSAAGGSCLSTTVGCAQQGCTATDVNGCTESCSTDGTTAYVCVGGAQLTIACTDYVAAGLEGTCEPETTSSGYKYVACL